MSKDKVLYVCVLMLSMMSAVKAIYINRNHMSLSCIKIHTSLNNRLNVNSNNLVSYKLQHRADYTLQHVPSLLSFSCHLHIVFQSTLAPGCPVFCTHSQTVPQPRPFSKRHKQELRSVITDNTPWSICTGTVSQPRWKCHTHTKCNPVHTVSYTILDDIKYVESTHVHFHRISLSIQQHDVTLQPVLAGSQIPWRITGTLVTNHPSPERSSID